MLNLYTQADSNIRKTWAYLFFFALMVIGLGWFISFLLETQVIVWVAVIFAVLINFFAYWYSDKIVLKMSGAKPIEKSDNPELYRILENLSITAGLPMPKLYIINEPQPNAFATGRDPKHGVIAVTTGLLEKLEKAEIEGVLAHELAHIGNRDVLLSTIIVILVGMVVIMTDFFFRASLGGGRNSSGKLAVVMIVISLVLMILAPLFAQIMKMAISRKREFLADSSGALLTRYPDGLARALEKIASDPNSMTRANDATAHMYISNPFRGGDKMSKLHKLFMTHPPVEERIKALRG
ncbi:MAG: M48 family metallopeptidase [Candidatus Nealsonbacteria bacterium]|nr:M48 family metallopeptidase [Candidatus Nealsonbacteria bacterium]